MSTFATDPSSPPASSFAHRPIGEIAATLPGATRLFRQHKLDFCCHGNLLLGEAVAAKEGNLASIETALRNLATSGRSVDDYPTDTDGLISHIITRYHESHRAEIPELIRLARRVEAVHRQNARAPLGLAEVLATVEAELGAHMAKEEEILFPAMMQGPNPVLADIVEVMRAEHEAHAEFLSQIERLTNDFTIPDEACNSWRALVGGAQKLVEDVMNHIHLENNILFPRVAPPEYAR